MALLGNYSVYHKLPEKFLTGTTLYGDRANFNKPGMMRSMGAGSGNDWDLAAIPQGFGAGGAWMLPRTRGGLTARRTARIVIEGTGTVRQGSRIVGSGFLTISGIGTGVRVIWSYIVGTSTLTISASGVGGRLIGAVGTATITIEGAGAIKAIMGASGSALITIAASMATGAAAGHMAGVCLLTIEGVADPVGIGWMAGTTAEAGLTPSGIAAAVWNAVAASFNLSGSMGAKMNAAGGSNSPEDIADAVWNELAAGHAIPDSFGDIMTFIKNIEGGRWRIVSNQMVFYAEDNLTEIARFNLFDNAGTPAMENVFERRRA
jgi:hypothetical protein